MTSTPQDWALVYARRLSLDTNDKSLQANFRGSVFSQADILKESLPPELFAMVYEAAETGDPEKLTALVPLLNSWAGRPDLNVVEPKPFLKPRAKSKGA